MKNLTMPVSSNPPHFALRWLQNATLNTPRLFISDITIMYKREPGSQEKIQSCSLHANNK